MIIDGIHIAQTPEQMELLDEFIEEYNVVTFIELGVYKGGLSNVMIKRQSENFKYYGFEFDLTAIESCMRSAPEITVADVNLKHIIEMIEQLISASNGVAYVLCDTFNKPREMTTYAKLLRVGDLLEGHDFPGEVSAEFLDKFGEENPDFDEIRPDEFRELGFTLWRKVK